MHWTPEYVKAEMEYRQRSARYALRTNALRAARGAHPSLLRRLLSH